jgi:molybdopterin molybdotransferase
MPPETRKPMITYEKAIETIKANAVTLGIESVDLQRSLNRVLRQDVVSDMDMPPFDKSAMDGYACRAGDTRNILDVVEVIPAGCQPRRSIGVNQCAKIMTGAILPPGADCVIQVEDVEELSGNTIRFKGERTAPNICWKGEDVVAGQRLVSAGTRITAKEVASLALAGCVMPVVSRKPRIGIIATGDEIVEPHEVPQNAQIRNSNSYQLHAQCLQFGGEPSNYGVVKDTADSIRGIIEKSKMENDLTLLTGGVSMGDFDLVPSILKEAGFDIFFEKISIQPGKPTVFGRLKNHYVFGLPGNPVSSFTVFEILVKELLSSMMGLNEHAPTIKCPLARAFKRKATARLAWIPVTITPEGLVEPVEYHGSAHITSLIYANGMIAVPIGVGEIPEGTVVDVRQI